MVRALRLEERRPWEDRQTRVALGVGACLAQVPLVMDVHVVPQLVEPLLSYHPLWLRAALVTALHGDLASRARSASSGGGGSGGGSAGAGASAGAAAAGAGLSPALASLLSSASTAALTRRGLVTVVREGLLYEREVQAAMDKKSCWVSCRRGWGAREQEARARNTHTRPRPCLGLHGQLTSKAMGAVARSTLCACCACAGGAPWAHPQEPAAGGAAAGPRGHAARH